MKQWLILGLAVITIFVIYQFYRYTYLEKSFDQVKLTMKSEQLDNLIHSSFQIENCPLGEIEGMSKEDVIKCNKVRIYRLGMVKFRYVYLDENDRVLFKTIVFSP